MRFADERIAATGAGLEAGRFTGMETDDLRAGTRAIVDFCDPNATKALHVGHLRNIALGQAVTSALRAAGAHVERQSHIGDAGRSMGEAMAGYQRYAAPQTPQQAGVKGDQFVGAAVRALRARGGAAGRRARRRRAGRARPRRARRPRPAAC